MEHSEAYKIMTSDLESQLLQAPSCAHSQEEIFKSVQLNNMGKCKFRSSFKILFMSFDYNLINLITRSCIYFLVIITLITCDNCSVLFYSQCSQ